MDTYNYNKEIQTNLKMFESAFDDTIIKRFNGRTGVARDSIKVNYLYGPKSRILTDLLGKPDTVKFPIVAITTTGYAKDTERIKNKLQDIIYETPDKEYVNLRCIPFNINVQMTILSKYFEDVDQIVQNFAVYSNPYIVYSIKEPKSGRELRVEVLWDGNVTLDYPGGTSDLPPNSPFRTTATANFTIKTYLFRTNVTPIKPICFIPTDIIVTDKFYCNYDTLTAHTSGNGMRDSYLIEGSPKIRYVNPYYITEGKTPTIKIQGDGYLNTFAVFVSGNTDVYPNPTVYFPNSSHGDMTPFYGIGVPEFNIISPREMTFTLPAPSASGFIDIVTVNPCGTGQLTVDANRCNRVENPYPIHMPEHYSWCVLQFPFLNGLIVNANLNTDTEIICDSEIIYVDNENVDSAAVLAQIYYLMDLISITKDDL